ncbi:MAG: hypothetical protein RIS70_3837, partial [Planctomycetota bacterium]
MRTKLRITCGVLLSGFLLAATTFGAPTNQNRSVRSGATAERSHKSTTARAKHDHIDIDEAEEKPSDNSAKKAAVGSGVRSKGPSGSTKASETKRPVQTAQARMPAGGARMPAARPVAGSMGMNAYPNRMPASMASRKAMRQQETIESIEEGEAGPPAESIPLKGDEYFEESMDGCGGNCGSCGGGCGSCGGGGGCGG